MYTCTKPAVATVILLSLALLGSACGGAGALLEEAETAIADAGRAENARKYEEAYGQFERAIAALDRIVREYPQSEAATRIRTKTQKVGRHTVQELKEVLVPRSRMRAQAGTDLAACALHTAASATSPKMRDAALEAVTTALTHPKTKRHAAHALVVADFTVRYVEDGKTRSALLCRVARAYHRSKAPEKALAATEAALGAAREIAFVADKPVALREAVRTFTSQGRFDRSIAVARTILDPNVRAHTLGELGFEVARAGRGEEATIVLEEAVQASELVTEPADKALRFAELAVTFALGRAPAGARSLLGKARALAQGLPITPKEAALAAIARGYAKIPDIGAAIDAALEIPSGTERGKALGSLVEDAEQAAEQTKDGGGLTAIATALEKVTDLDARADSLTACAKALGRLGRHADALQVALRIPMPPTRARTLTELGPICETDEVYEAAGKASRAVFEDSARAEAMARLAGTLAYNGRIDAAKAAIREAVDIADAAQAADVRMARQTAVGLAALEGRQAAIAHAALVRALGTSSQITDPASRGTRLIETARGLVRVGAGEEIAAAVGQVVKAVAEVELEGTQARLLTALTRELPSFGRAAALHLEAIGRAIRSLEGQDRRASNLARLARAYAALGRFDDARAVADALTKAKGGFVAADPVLVELAAAAARAGRFPLAANTAEAIHSPLHRARALAETALVHLVAGSPKDPALAASLRRLAKL